MRQTIKEIEVNVAYSRLFAYRTCAAFFYVTEVSVLPTADFSSKAKFVILTRNARKLLKEFLPTLQESHSLRYTNYRASPKVKFQVTLVFVCMNLKKLPYF